MRLLPGNESLAFNGLQWILRRSFQCASWQASKSDFEHVKTSVHFITHPKEKPSKMKKRAYVTRYGPKGFVVQGSRVVGSLIIAPGMLLHWKVNTPEEITPESLELFSLLDPTLDIVVIGTGDKFVKLNKEVHKAMRKKGIALEVQDTANACATHNFLLEEGRVTGAALIPPTHLITKQRWMF